MDGCSVRAFLKHAESLKIEEKKARRELSMLSNGPSPLFKVKSAQARETGLSEEAPPMSGAFFWADARNEGGRVVSLFEFALQYSIC